MNSRGRVYKETPSLTRLPSTTTFIQHYHQSLIHLPNHFHYPFQPHTIIKMQFFVPALLLLATAFAAPLQNANPVVDSIEHSNIVARSPSVPAVVGSIGKMVDGIVKEPPKDPKASPHSLFEKD